ESFLPTLTGDALAEVALRIEKANGDEGQAEVAGLFAVVAGEDTQAPRVDGQRLVEAELSAEVGDGSVDGLGMRAAARGIVGLHVGVEGGERGVVAGEEVGIGGAARQEVAVYFGEDAYAAVFDALPERGINAGVEGRRFGVPGPPEVIGKLVQARDAF